MVRSLCDVQERHHGPGGRRLPGTWGTPEMPPLAAALLERSPLRFVSAAQWWWRDGARIRSRCLPTTNLAYYFAGSGWVTLAGERLRVEPGIAILTPRGWPQAVVHDRGCPYRALSVHTQWPAFGGGGSDLAEVLGLPRRLVCDPRSDAVLVEAMTEMARLDADRPPGWLTLAQAWMTVLAHHLVASRSPRTAVGKNAMVAMELAPALDYIEEALPGGVITVADLGRRLGLGPVATRQRFHRGTGLAPNRYIQRRRVDRACLLLRQDARSVAQVAAAVGCPDVSAFHRLFRRWTGTTPDGWRRDPDAAVR